MKVMYKDTLVAESNSTEEVEGNQYFPPDSVKVKLEDSPTPYTCPWKGKCQYYNVVIGEEKIEDGAWGYPDPKEAAMNIKGFITFDKTKGFEISE